MKSTRIAPAQRHAFPSHNPHNLFATRHAIAVAIACFGQAAMAMDFQLTEDVKLKFNSTVTLGTTLRTEGADPAVYGTLSAARVGATPGQLAPNAGGNDLNFQAGQAVSTVLKGVADFELSRKNLGLFVRVKAWNDFELKNGGRAYGNTPNGYARNVPLSDNGFDPNAAFSNAQFADVYFFGKTDLNSTTALDGRVGRQVLSWGAARLTGGGVGAISPSDVPASGRPGALPQESKVPVGMISVSVKDTKGWGFDGFIPYEFRANVLAGCGTFYSATNYAAVGCNFASVLPALNDPTALANGQYSHRRSDVFPDAGGQLGLSGRYTAASLGTEFRGYLVNYHSVAPSIRVINPNVAGGYGALTPANPVTSTRLTSANPLGFSLIYPENIQLLGATFETRLNPTTAIYGELAHRANQPLNLNSADLTGAFLGRSPTSLLQTAKGVLAVPPGGTFDGYDRYGVTNLTLGMNKVFEKAAGASRVTVTGELGLSSIAGLPDPSVLRYGRSDDYGGATINGVNCVDTTAAQKSCARDGFVSAMAWGFRVRAAATYPGALFGATLTPSILVAQDVRGYSFDGSFNQGRLVVRPAIRADWGAKYFGEIQYTNISGGAYNNQIDRDTLTLSAGVNF